MSLKPLLSALLAAAVAGAVSADQPAPLPGAAPAEEWASNPDLAGEVTRLQVKPPQNSSFAAYHVKDQGVQAVVPVKLALVGADPLSVAFLKKYHDRLQAEHFTVLVLLIGDADILRQFREAWPALEVQRFDLDNRLLLMLHVIGIRYYPALYDQGQVSP